MLNVLEDDFRIPYIVNFIGYLKRYKKCIYYIKIM